MNICSGRAGGGGRTAAAWAVRHQPFAECSIVAPGLINILALQSTSRLPEHSRTEALLRKSTLPRCFPSWSSAAALRYRVAAPSHLSKRKGAGHALPLSTAALSAPPGPGSCTSSRSCSPAGPDQHPAGRRGICSSCSGGGSDSCRLLCRRRRGGRAAGLDQLPQRPWHPRPLPGRHAAAGAGQRGAAHSVAALQPGRDDGLARGLPAGVARGRGKLPAACRAVLQLPPPECGEPDRRRALASRQRPTGHRPGSLCGIRTNAGGAGAGSRRGGRA